MKLKTARNLIVLAFLFIFTANFSLEARHYHHRYTEVHVVNQQYYTPVYTQSPYVVQQYYQQPVYAVQPAPVVVYQQAPVVYQERVYVRERSCPGKSLVTFALGLGIGLLAR